MSVLGSCLCGGFQFQITQADEPSEICHCTRCRKKSGATSLEMVNVRSEHYKVISGAELVHTYEAPILNRPPAYLSHFCSRCGSLVPPVKTSEETVEIPAGLFDDDPKVQPDKHIFVDFMPSWHVIRDSLPQLNLRELIRHRFGRDLPSDFQFTDHNSTKHKI